MSAVNPDTVAASSQAAGLPPHLQHAVHRALSDLQASRLLYPQQCAAAEAAIGDERPTAERWVPWLRSNCSLFCAYVNPLSLHVLLRSKPTASPSWTLCRRVLAALGGSLDYAAARAELEQGRRAAKQLHRGRSHRTPGGSGIDSDAGTAGARAW